MAVLVTNICLRMQLFALPHPLHNAFIEVVQNRSCAQCTNAAECIINAAAECIINTAAECIINTAAERMCYNECISLDKQPTAKISVEEC